MTELGVLQVGLGPLGVKVAGDLVRRGIGRVVAAVDPADGIVGRPVAELIGGSSNSGAVLDSIDAVRDWTGVRCAIVTTSSDLELCMDTFRGLLRRGVPVVSTCEELSWPWLRHPVLASELHELAVKHRVPILGTGVNPGFLMDALPVAATTLCGDVRRVSIERVLDASTRRIPFQKKIGAGEDMAGFERRVADGSLRHVGLGESLHFVAHHLGFELDGWTEEIVPVMAESGFESDLGPIETGMVRGVHQVARGEVRGEDVLELVFHAALREPDPFDRITVVGDPALDLTFRGGVHGDTATSAVVLNMVRTLVHAEPALHTMGSLPLTGCHRP